MSRSVLAAVLALALLAVAMFAAPGCNGSFRFDDVPFDSGASQGSDDGGGAEAAGSYASCQIDTDCVLASLHCDALSGACVECTSDMNCPASSPRCDGALHRCVQCGVDQDCPQTPRVQTCELTTRTCILACMEGSGTESCASPTPICSESKKRCVQCASNDDCKGDASGKHECDPLSGRCSECDQDSECPGDRPRCDRIHDVCVQCTAQSDCPGDRPLCDPASYMCVTLP